VVRGPYLEMIDVEYSRVFAMIPGVVMDSFRSGLLGLSCILCFAAAPANADSARAVSTTDTFNTSPVIVVGFVGGFVKHDNAVHSTVQVAARLRQEFPSGVYVGVFENHHRNMARQQILRMVDTDGDGTLSNEEKKNAHIILYGHSWGASEAVTLARELAKENIPVMLTIQVDSVSKPGENDSIIPTNVAEAVNFYQHDGFLHGRSEIRAADPEHTHILGNFRSDYKTNPITCASYPWYYRLFMKSHIEIECDPIVWTQVESLIGSNLPPQRSPAGSGLHSETKSTK
jgi:hypothetical protein